MKSVPSLKKYFSRAFYAFHSFRSSTLCRLASHRLHKLRCGTLNTHWISIKKIKYKSNQSTERDCLYASIRPRLTAFFSYDISSQRDSCYLKARHRKGGIISTASLLFLWDVLSEPLRPLLLISSASLGGWAKAFKSSRQSLINQMSRLGRCLRKTNLSRSGWERGL